ncbi:MAG: signal peptidase II, partial [Candidatus Berkelbacteria bacterium]
MKKSQPPYFPTVILLILLQVANYLIQKYASAEVNSQLIFGTLGDNAIAIGVSLLLILILVISHKKGLIEAAPVYLIIAGAVSNIFDRVFYGGVIDYFTLPLIPMFNIADICIVMGIGIFIYHTLSQVYPVNGRK